MEVMTITREDMRRLIVHIWHTVQCGSHLRVGIYTVGAEGLLTKQHLEEIQTYTFKTDF